MRRGFLFAIVTCGSCGQPAPPPLTGSATSEAPATPERLPIQTDKEAYTCS